MIRRIAVRILLSLAVISISVWAQPSREIIQPVTVHVNRVDTLLLSDLFYAPSYPVRFLPSNDVTVSFDADSRSLVIRPKKSFRGATLLEFRYGKERYALPVFVRGDETQQKPHVFRYVPDAPVSQVAVSGSFNGWDKSRDRLVDLNKTGVYELALALEPGNYIYKFIVDGKEILDPANPEKSPTGFDDFNSVLRIADSDTAKPFLHVGKCMAGKKEVVFSYVYESHGPRNTLLRAHVLALLDNQRIDPSRIEVDGRNVRIRLPRTELNGERTLRVAVTRKGQISNLQQALIVDGLPAASRHESARWEDGIIYSIMIDRFLNGDPSNDNPVKHDSIFVQANYQGGDFRGIIRKIDEGYFDSLGINILWISPVYDNPNVAFREYPPPHRWYSGYHGYWPISDTRVEEKFGTMEELKELVAKAHRHGIRVLLDFVAHHVHIDHPFYKDHPEWFGTLDLPDGRKNLRLWDEFRLSTWFEPYMPSFDFTKSQQAVDTVAANAIWWLKQTGADGFRHDAVKHVPNLFWRELTRRLNAEIEIPGDVRVYQIGETFGDYDLVGSYVNNGQLSAQFNFNLSYFAIPVFLEPERSFAFLDFHMKRTFAAHGQYHLMGNIMDSHDKVRFMAYADGKVKSQGVDTREMAWNNPPTVDHASSYRKAEQYLAYMFTIPGLPVVYYGSEFGMTGADDPDNRRMMRFGDQLSDWERGMLPKTQQIVKMRSAHTALRYGDFLTLRADETIYAYLRADFNERLLVVLNKNEQPFTADLMMPEALKVKALIDVNSGESFPVTGNKVSIPIAGIGWKVLKALSR